MEVITMNYDDYICGTKFRDIAHTVVDEKGYHGMPGINTPKPLIVYAHTHNFKYACDYINTRHAAEFVLITHNSDGCVRHSDYHNIKEHDADAHLLPPNVIKWYAQNVDLGDYDNIPSISEKIVPLPIGLENSYCFPYDKAAMLFEKTKQTHNVQHKFYANFNINTNVLERARVINHCGYLKQSEITIKLKVNGDDYNEYLNDLSTHIAIVSPRGNGLDCHRTWEALYLGRIPVMVDVPSFNHWTLPIYMLDKWQDLNTRTEDIMRDVLMYKKHWNTFDIQSLSFNYWRNRIINGK